MRLQDAAVPTFARHETFHPRYGWFRKAYTFASKDPSVFTRDAAPVIIGVGKNMVRAIRFWGLAAKLIVEDPEPANRRAPGVVPTRLGHALFGPAGWDPYMEDPGTLWLLHWLLLARPSMVPVWWLAFNEFTAVEFVESDLVASIDANLEAAADWASPHSSSVRKDISAMFRTYAPMERARRSGLDELLDCPMRELGLVLRSASLDGGYRFSLGPKPTLPAEIVAFAVLDHVSRLEVGGQTITLGRLATEPGSPGRAFKLTESELAGALMNMDLEGLAVTSPAGASQLSWDTDPAEMAGQTLATYFGKKSPLRGAPRCGGPAGAEPISDTMLENLGVGRDASESVARLFWMSQLMGNAA